MPPSPQKKQDRTRIEIHPRCCSTLCHSWDFVLAIQMLIEACFHSDDSKSDKLVSNKILVGTSINSKIEQIPGRTYTPSVEIYCLQNLGKYDDYCLSVHRCGPHVGALLNHGTTPPNKTYQRNRLADFSDF